MYFGVPYRKCKLRKTSIIVVIYYDKDCLLLYVPLENIYSHIIRSHHCCSGATIIRNRPIGLPLNCKALDRREYLSYLDSSITACRHLISRTAPIWWLFTSKGYWESILTHIHMVCFLNRVLIIFILLLYILVLIFNTNLSSLGLWNLSHSYKDSLSKAPWLYHSWILEMVMECVTISIIPSSLPVAIQP